MAKFKYTARDAKGKKRTGEITADTQTLAVMQLKRQRLTVLSIKQNAGLFAPRPPKPKCKAQDLVIFTRQFATMLEAGLPVTEILDVLYDQTDYPGFKLAVGDVRDSVRGGADLSTSLARYPRIFTSLYVNMIRAGEASGDLDVILKRLASYLEKSESLRRRIKSAMTYPCVSLGMVILITIGLLVFIIPQFVEIFDKLGAELPTPTKIVIFLSDSLRYNWYMWVIAMVAAYLGYKAAIKTERGRFMFDSFKLKMPVFGELVQKVALSRFSRTFATMLKSGVPMLGSLDIVATTSGNGVIEKAVSDCREAVRQGEPLATPLGECSVFPPMIVRMINIGERTGALEVLLEKVSDFYDEQVDAAVESLTSIIEPVMIGLMGIIVGGIVVAIFLPILQMSQAVGK